MLLFLHGQDSFRTHERLETLRRGFQEKYDSGGTSMESLAAEAVKPEDIRLRLLTQGLFVMKRFIVIRDIFHLSEAAAAAFCESVPRLDQNMIVVATAEDIPKAKSALKTTVDAADRVEEYKPLTDAQVEVWAKRRIKEAGVEIDPAAFVHLLHSVGNDLWTLYNVIQQLAHYAPSSRITVQDVELFVQSPLDDNVFHFSDALAERNTQRALHLLHDQLAAGANPFYVLSMLARQLSILIEIKETDGKGSSLHPYVIKKTRQHAQRFDRRDLERLYRQLIEIDYAMKSTQHDPQLLLDRFVVEATRSKNPSA